MTPLETTASILWRSVRLARRAVGEDRDAALGMLRDIAAWSPYPRLREAAERHLRTIGEAV